MKYEVGSMKYEVRIFDYNYELKKVIPTLGKSLQTKMKTQENEMKKLITVAVMLAVFVLPVSADFTAADARTALRIAAELDEYNAAYDLNNDGEVRSCEARQILRYSAGLEYILDETEATMLAKVMWGEARGCSKAQRAAVGWCILNRVDDDRFPDTVYAVISQPNQFYYYDTFPCTDENYALACDVLTRHNAELSGVAVYRELPQSYFWYTGNGKVNTFRTQYTGGTYYTP